MERTFVMLKPDCVQRGLAGEAVSRLERTGLKLVALKMVKPSKDFVEKFYPSSDEWLRAVGGKTLENYEKYGIDAEKEVGTKDALKIGKMVKKWLVDFISSAPVVAMAWEGNHSVDIVRKIVGHTLPLSAAPGTIRGDYSVDSSDSANARKRPIRNLIHASGTVEEAKHEIGLWFSEKEIHSYKRADEAAMFE
ncbi:MAG: nucleoside-diphosphate kinase [Candidatus Micrarchaeota archaeon]|nr:nucleoside-diphosphate kinase [Candidatus Micrarchaeota archaeon]